MGGLLRRMPQHDSRKAAGEFGICGLAHLGAEQTAQRGEQLRPFKVWAARPQLASK
jgi:hypothetical protein